VVEHLPSKPKALSSTPSITIIIIKITMNKRRRQKPPATVPGKGKGGRNRQGGYVSNSSCIF
jgi:hypothetical protein